MKVAVGFLVFFVADMLCFSPSILHPTPPRSDAVMDCEVSTCLINPFW